MCIPSVSVPILVDCSHVVLYLHGPLNDGLLYPFGSLVDRRACPVKVQFCSDGNNFNYRVTARLVLEGAHYLIILHRIARVVIRIV